MTGSYPRDLHGYGDSPPDPRWPGGARLALQIVLNYEEGGENCILHGDASSETYLADIINPQAREGARHMNMESVYDYGARVGVWRLKRLFDRYDVPVTVFAVGMAVERNPEAIHALHAAGHEISSHGYRWVDYQHVDASTEREHIRKSIVAITRATGERPLGWYTGRCGPNTRALVVEEGGFLYDSDDYSDELPYWNRQHGPAHLVIPYTLDANDMRYVIAPGFGNGRQFLHYLKDSFDVLYAQGAEYPRLMSVGLHCRLSGHPGRSAAIEAFLRYARSHEHVWWCRRIDIARHWHACHPPG